jgi:phenylpyruvate tautomerase PptA (4-oxalocrotonate tautomerase family)
LPEHGGELVRRDPDDVMVVFVETAWENWAFAGGRLLHAA